MATSSMLIYGQQKTPAEVKEFVSKYVSDVKRKKTDRFHNIMSFISNVPQGSKKALDYGCGWGHFSVAIKEKGYDVTGIDYSPNEVEICNSVWGSQEYLNFSTSLINELEDQSFDLVLSNQVIEHVHNVGNYLSEINRVLSVGGELVLALPNIMNPRFYLSLMKSDLEQRLINESKRTAEQYNKAHDHINAWDPYHLVRLVSTVGFELKEYLPMEGTPTPFKFLPYIFFKNKRLKNHSYTMLFRFVKKENVYLPANS